jgi:hypothetical protein
VVLAYPRFRQVRPAITNRNSQVVPVPFAPFGGPEATVRAMRSGGITHVALRRRTNGRSERERAIEALREYLAGAQRPCRLVRETEQIEVFELARPDGS